MQRYDVEVFPLKVGTARERFPEPYRFRTIVFDPHASRYGIKFFKSSIYKYHFKLQYRVLAKDLKGRAVRLVSECGRQPFQPGFAVSYPVGDILQLACRMSIHITDRKTCFTEIADPVCRVLLRKSIIK